MMHVIRRGVLAMLVMAIIALPLISWVTPLPATVVAALSVLPLAFGAVVTSDFLDALYKNFKAIYNREFLAAEQIADYKRLATEVPSTTATESYNWLGEVPKMQEWLDERGYKGLHAFEYALKNKDWEAPPSRWTATPWRTTSSATSCRGSSSCPKRPCATAWS